MRSVLRKEDDVVANLEDLEKRLTAVEQELAILREYLFGPHPDETPAERGARLLRHARLSQASLSAAWDRALQEMGIRGEPIGAENVQRMIAAEGFKPEDNEFSRGIIEMREE